MNVVTKNFLDSLIGKTKDQAIELCRVDDYQYRVVYQDGKYYGVTYDLNFNRVNFTIENNIIIEATIG
jgi:hypothetical protein